MNDIHIINKPGLHNLKTFKIVLINEVSLLLPNFLFILALWSRL